MQSVPARPSVLLIEDDSKLAEIFRSLLEESLSITVALDARSALSTLLTGSFDWVLLDLRLGLDSGRKLYTHVVTHRPDLAPRFIVTTGGATTRDDAAFLAAMEPRVLYKPFLPEELLALLRKLQGARRQTPRPQPMHDEPPTLRQRDPIVWDDEMPTEKAQPWWRAASPE